MRLFGFLSPFTLATTLLVVSPATSEVQPRIVLVERDPWVQVLGSDSPTFALYSNGFVIFRGTSGSNTLFSAQLTATEYQGLLTSMAPESLLRLGDRYVGSERTDQPTNELHVWVDGTRKTISVYGTLRIDPDVRRRTPASFLRTFDAITKFSAEGRPWLPDRIELLLWPFEHSREVPAEWPAAWPDLSEARARGSEGLHQIFVPAAQYETLRELLDGLQANQAVRLGGRKWAISFRLPLPQEDLWMR